MKGFFIADLSGGKYMPGAQSFCTFFALIYRFWRLENVQG